MPAREKSSEDNRSARSRPRASADEADAPRTLCSIRPLLPPPLLCELICPVAMKPSSLRAAARVLIAFLIADARLAEAAAAQVRSVRCCACARAQTRLRQSAVLLRDLTRPAGPRPPLCPASRPDSSSIRACQDAYQTPGRSGGESMQHSR